MCTVPAKEHSRQAYEHTYTASLTTQGTETITRVCTVLNSSKVNTRMSTHTCGIPGHTRHRKDYESVCSTEKQHSQQASELYMHTAPLTTRGTVLQGSTADMCMSTHAHIPLAMQGTGILRQCAQCCKAAKPTGVGAHSIPGHARHRGDNERV